MKKIIFSMACVLVIFGFSSCSVGSFLVDDVNVHNSLVAYMDKVLDGEERFYDEYMELSEGDEVEEITKAYEDFSVAVRVLDDFFVNTTFASSQQVFKEDYYNEYKPFISGYIAYAEEFVNEISQNGVSFDVMDPFLDPLDRYTVDFVDIHNRLINTINLQSDEV